MIRALVLALVSVLVLPALASADVIHLTNGRTMEGQVLKTKKGMIHLKVPGGRLMIPANTVKRVERRKTPQEEYAKRARRVNTSDPAQLRTLAHWASGRGLGEQAMQLRAQAKGLELDARVSAIRSAVTANPFLDLYHWARDKRHSVVVQRWLLEEALKRDPKHVASRVALRALDAAEERLARLRARPDQDAQPEPEQKIDALEAKLDAQESEAQKLRARLAALEEEARQRECEATRFAQNQRRRRRIRRRNRSRTVSPRVAEVPGTVVARPPPSTLYGKPARLKWD